MLCKLSNIYIFPNVFIIYCIVYKIFTLIFKEKIYIIYTALNFFLMQVKWQQSLTESQGCVSGLWGTTQRLCPPGKHLAREGCKLKLFLGTTRLPSLEPPLLLSSWSSNGKRESWNESFQWLPSSSQSSRCFSMWNMQHLNCFSGNQNVPSCKKMILC